MSHTNRVFVTGLGALTASGSDVDTHWQAITNGCQSISEIEQWDLSSWPHRLGGEIKSLKPAAMLPDKKLTKVISRQDVLGIYAAMQAVDNSGCLDYRNTLKDSQRFDEESAVFVGSPGNKYYQQYDFLPLLAKTNHNMQAFGEELFGQVHPMWLLRILPNNVLAYVGIHCGFKGANHNIANHAVSGVQAIIEARHAIASGLAKRAVVVAYDVGIEPQALFYYTKMGVISARCLSPFDAAHDGTILAEGAAALVLESEESLRERDAKPIAEIIGGLSNTEGQGLFSIEADGDALGRLMSRTLEQHQVKSQQIGLVTAHANGNAISDNSEAQAIKSVFNNHNVPVTGFKWAMGHTLCASGTLDTVLSICAMQENIIPGIANLNEPASDCAHLNIDKASRAWDLDKPYAMIVNRGFASLNACLLVRSCDDF